MIYIWITNLVDLKPNAKRSEALVMIHTVEHKDGSVKVHFLSPADASEAEIVPSVVSNVAEGKMVRLSASYDSRGRLGFVKKA